MTSLPLLIIAPNGQYVDIQQPFNYVSAIMGLVLLIAIGYFIHLAFRNWLVPYCKRVQRRYRRFA